MGDEESLVINEHVSENSPTTSRHNEEIVIDDESIYDSSDDDYQTEEEYEEDECARTVSRSVRFDRSLDAGKSTRYETFWNIFRPLLRIVKLTTNYRTSMN